MKQVLAVPFAVWRQIRGLRRRIKILELRLRGVTIDSSAIVHPKASIEPSGGRIVIGARTYIDLGVVIRALGGEVQIGDDCSVNAYSVLHGSGGLQIGDGTRIGSHTVIVPSNHNFSQSDVPLRDQGLSMQGITIADEVWIGAGARILDGVAIGSRAVVGAGAVVTKPIEAGVVVGGVPARPLRPTVAS